MVKKYNVGDRVRIVKEKVGCGWNGTGQMDAWLGKIMTIKSNDSSYYKMEEDKGLWCWDTHMIDGLVILKSSLISGKHWVQNLRGDIGCVMDKGLVFKNSSVHIDNFDDNLKSLCGKYDTIVKILEPKDDWCGNLCNIDVFNIIKEINHLKPITSLDELEEIRKKMCEKYDASFYITNESGKWEIKSYIVTKPIGLVHGSGEGVCVDWENKCYTVNLLKSIDLEKEGYELKI